MSDVPAGRRYHVREILGRGGFGTVYRAELVTEGGFGKVVALKVLHRAIEGRPGQLSRLRDEARVLGIVRHRAVVAADALVRLDGHWTVVMEYIPGATIAEVLRAEGGMPPSVALTVCAEVASGLQAVWQAETQPGKPLHLLHRDVKPSNLQLTDMGDVKILDFGVARADFDGREAATQQVVYGSPPYLSPERLELLDTPGGDVFALGATLAEMLSGHRPEAVVARPQPHAERVRRLVEATDDATGDRSLSQFIEHMMAYDVEDRPSMAEVEQHARALRKRHNEPDIREWCKAMVPKVQARREVSTGEMSGRAFDETTGGLESLEQLPGAASRTWDPAPTTIPPQATPAPPEAAPAPPPAAPVAPPPPVVAPASVEAPAPTGSSLMTWVRNGIAALLVSVGAASAAALVVLAVGAVATGALCWVSWGAIASEGCSESIRDADVLLDGVPKTRTTAQARAVTGRARAACRTGQLGLFDATTLHSQIEDSVADGSWDTNDQRALERLATDLLPPP